jgi:hypothetical protein
MRQLFVTMMASGFAFVLAACGSFNSGPPPTATSAIDPNAPAVEPGVFNPRPFATAIPEDGFPTLDPNQQVTLQARGMPITIVAPTGPTPTSLFQGANMPFPGEIEIDTSAGEFDYATGFTEVSLTRFGGPTDDVFQAQFLPDGSVFVNGEFSRNIGPQGVIEINALLAELRFFEIRGTFAALQARPDDYIYDLRVNQNDSSSTLTADDSLMPIEIARVINSLLQIAEGFTPPPTPGG